ncbi:MAG: N-acetyltransferase, partial [Burkholderiales bacterium]
PSSALRAALPVLQHAAARAVEPRRWIARDDLLVLYPGPDAIVVRSAGLGDAREIHALLENFAARGLLLPRTLDQVCRTIRDFVVAVEHGRIVGCGALKIYSETLAEVAALAVAEDRHGAGIGSRIVRALNGEAWALGIRRLFALTLQESFFRRLGFRTVPVTEFPEKLARDCASCDRRSNCIEIAVAHEVTEDSIRSGKA